MKRWLIIASSAIVVVLLLGYGGLKLVDSRTFQFFGGLTARVETGRKVVALTFDDGPDPAGTSQLLATLAREHVHGTFFLIGSALAQYPALGRQIAAAGHQLGNHTYSHERMVFCSPGFVESEITRTDALIRQTGFRGEIDFRPPNGKKGIALPWYLAQHNRKTIMWDVEPNSYPEVDRTAAATTSYVVSHVRPGSIVILHGMYANRQVTRDALGPIIDQLRTRGYRFVTVSELLALSS
ncbi:polysaccharide deacetylase family protein [Fodinicola acaciae]|uniref:polysaccharide deacetylase family protein n=1 Tax=Fodinicola acaciae TaxID=2681555 RepID=UPI0013D5F430|nr:polysaccharide deacetylase family protein [Fodinicola acaciae]